METIKLFTVLSLDDDKNEKYHTTGILFWEVENMFNSSNYNIIFTNNIDESDLIFLDFFTSVYSEKEFHDSIEKHKQIKSKYKTKNFFGLSYHEIHDHEKFEKKINIIENELNIDLHRIFYVGTSLTNYRSFNNIPFEFKLRQFLFHVKNINTSDNEIRNKKLTYLTNKSNFSRFRVFDKTLHLYQNVNKFKSENNVSFLNTNKSNEFGGSLSHYVGKISNLHHSLEYYEKLNLPWEIDRFPNEWEKDEICQSVYDHHCKSIFSLVLETENDHDLKTNNTPFIDTQFYDKINLNRLQFSEKTILPLIAESMPFFITDNLFYRTYEDLGFDFGYLKDIFDINYKRNNFYQNYLSLEKFISFIRDTTIDDLNKVRDKHYNYIENNNKVTKQLIEGFSENEIKFVNKMLNKK